MHRLNLTACLLACHAACAFASAQATTAPTRSPTLEVTTDRREAVYPPQEPITFRAFLKNGTLPIDDGAIEYVITKDGGAKLSSGIITSAKGGATVQASLPDAGFVRCELTFTPPTTRPVRAVAAAGVDPVHIKPALPAPDDFDAFWDAQKALVAAEPMKPVLKPVSKSSGVETFDVQVNCPGGAPLSGYLAKPIGAKPKSLPAILYPHSAGVRSSQLTQAVKGAKMGLLALDFNAHGIPNGKPDKFYADLMNGELKSYAAMGRERRETIYFRGMILRVLRALEFITAQPEWDGRILIVEGSSQGGGQALIAAGLDPRVTLCLASVPALCDHAGYLAGRQPGWPRIVPQVLQKSANGKYDEAATEAARYVDAANFAARIKCPTHVTVGFIDHVCSPSSVYAAFNSIPAGVEKQIINRPTMGHSFPPDLIAQFDEEIRRHISK